MLTKHELFREIRERLPEFSESDVAMMIINARLDDELVTGTVRGYLTLCPGADIPRDYWIIRGTLFVRAPNEEEWQGVLSPLETAFSCHKDGNEALLCLRGLARFTDVRGAAVRWDERLGVAQWFVTVPTGTDIEAAKQCLLEHQAEIYG